MTLVAAVPEMHLDCVLRQLHLLPIIVRHRGFDGGLSRAGVDEVSCKRVVAANNQLKYVMVVAAVDGGVRKDVLIEALPSGRTRKIARSA